MLLRSEPVHARPGNAEPLCNVSGADAVSQQAFDLVRIDALWSAPIDPLNLRRCDALKLPLAPQVGLELGKNAQHVQKRLTRRRSGIDRLFRCPEVRTLLAKLMHDVLQVPHAPGEAVNAGDHKRVAGPHEVQKRL